MRNTTGRRRRLVRKVGMTAAVPVLTFTLCPIADEQNHTDSLEYPPVNPVGAFAINYVSSAAAHDRLFTIPTQHDHVPEQNSDFVQASTSFVASGQQAAPFFSGSDGSDAVRIGWEARYRAQSTIARNSTPVPSRGVLWYASMQATQSPTT
jgi:hypothetical protein